MKRVIFACLILVILASCATIGFLVLPDRRELAGLLQTYVMRYGEYDDYAVSSQARGDQLSIGFHWRERGRYVIFCYFDGRWLIYDEGVLR